MPRKSNYRDQGREQIDNVVNSWKEEFPERFSPDKYHLDEEYVKHRESSRGKYRRKYIEKDYDDYSKREEKSRKDFNGQSQWVEKSSPNDFETYGYECKTQTYLGSPLDSDGERKRENHKKDRYEKTMYKQYSPESRWKYERDYPKEENRVHKIKESHHKRYSYSSDRDILNHAAIKIQAAYRGYRTRKYFWKKMERHRRQESLANAKPYSQDEYIIANAKPYRQDEYIIANATSIADDANISALVASADPNLGLTAPLPYVDSAQKHNIIQELKNTVSYSGDISTVSQLQTEASPTIIILGGINPSQSTDYLLGASMFVYNVQKDKWFFGGVMPEPRNYHTAAYLNGKIYITGGYSPLLLSGSQMLATQSTFQLTVRSKRWRKRADMHQARACHGMCIVNGNLMVMGGRDATGKLLSTVELYYPKEDQWVRLKSMPEAIMGLSCVVLNGCVYVLGGIVNEGHATRYVVSSRVYAYAIEKQMWYRTPILPEPRAFACAATLKREIWLWCGVKDALDQDGCLMSSNSVLVYNSEFSKWEQRTAIGTLKHAAAIAKFGRRIHILGGMSSASGSKEILNENDYYNRETDKYMEVAALPRPLTGSAVVALPIDYVATSDPKWNTENINEDVEKEAATKIQSVYRGHRTRSLISNHKLPVYSSPSDIIKKKSRMNALVMHTSMADPYTTDKWKSFQRVQIDEWPPTPNPQASHSAVNLRCGALPKGYTVTSTNNRTKVRRYVLLPPHADPNMSMTGHLCNVYKKAKKILGLRKVERLPAFAANLITAPILQDDSMPVILILGGLQPRDPINLSNGKLILRYHTLKNRWEYFGALPEPRNYHAAVYYEENIYVTGGCDPDTRNSGEMIATNTTYSLNIHLNEWVKKAEMHCCRSHHSLVTALGKIFAVGGRDNNGRFVASIEAYDIENDEWTLLRPMTAPRMGMACAVIDDHIWCMGGLGLSDDSENLTYPVLASVVSYDIGKDVWISRPPLRCPRAFGSCAVVDDFMWLCGGASRDRSNSALISMGSIDKYYPTEAEWRRKTLISNPRHSAAVVAVDSCIYVFGGVSSQEWSPLARNEMIVVDDISLHSCADLPIPLTGLTAVAIPPVIPSLRSESLAILLHTKLTYH